MNPDQGDQQRTQQQQESLLQPPWTQLDNRRGPIEWPPSTKQVMDNNQNRVNPKALTAEERAVISECNSNSLWFRCVPITLGLGFLTSAAQKAGKIPPPASPLAYAGRVVGLGMAGFLMGKFTYVNECKQLIQQRIPDSNMAKIIRGEALPDDQQQNTFGQQRAQLYGYQQPQQQQQQPGFQMPQHPPQQAEYDGKQFVQPEMHNEQQEGQQQEQSSMTYDQLRQQRRQDDFMKYRGPSAPQQQQPGPFQQPPPPPPPARQMDPAMQAPPSKKRVRVNQYGDEIEE